MKKGCIGCLGGGCLTVIVVIVVGIFWGYNWCNTTGKSFAVSAMKQIGNEIANNVFEPETAAEIASLTAEMQDDFNNDKLGIIDTFTYCINNATDTWKVQGAILLGGMYRKLTGNITSGDAPDLQDSEGAEIVRTVIYALSQGKIDGEETSRLAKVMIDDEKSGSSSPSIIGDNPALDINSTNIKHGISKDDMVKAVNALKEYAEKNNLETPSDDITVDATVKDLLVNFIKNLRSNCTK